MRTSSSIAYLDGSFLMWRIGGGRTKAASSNIDGGDKKSPAAAITEQYIASTVGHVLQHTQALVLRTD
jgi:hypothetical protein